MIIDSSYFLTKELFIPNAEAQPSIGGNTPTSKIQLEQVIEEKESELLIKFLGLTQYNELKEQFEVDGSWKPTALQKWKNLVDGKDEWRGLRYEVGGKKYSLIAYYVFFYYLSMDFSHYTTTGIQVLQSDNTTKQTPNQTQVRIWMKFLKMYQSGLNYGSPTFFQNWNGLGAMWNGVNYDGVSLYEFMNKNLEFGTTFFNYERPINSMNL
jgi:hypothetical protein